MEADDEDVSQQQTNGSDPPSDPHIPSYDDLLAELESLRKSHEELRSRCGTMEEDVVRMQSERDEGLGQISGLKTVVTEVSSERDLLRGQLREFEVSFKEKEDGFLKKMGEELCRNEELEKEVDFSRERIKRLELEFGNVKSKHGFLLERLDSLKSVKEPLLGIIEGLDSESVIEGLDSESVIDLSNNDEGSIELELESESMAVGKQITSISKLVTEAETRIIGFKEKKMKETKELENSVVSLTEENRDINSLLRVALLEKEAVEKSLNKLKGNTEQKRVALLQIAERGLQRVGFGFMMGSGNVEQPVESSSFNSSATPASTTASTKSDSSECEEEVVSLASTVERIMKNLRLEIGQLRRSLEESRSDTERLQSLANKQAQEIADDRLYIKNLEDRERILAQNVEELLLEIKEMEVEVARWREACELEVKAGKKEIDERDKVVTILKQELEKTKAALDVSNSKLKLKEELAAAAIGAQAAAERSLQLADSRSAELRDRIEELTKQLEEAEAKERSRHKVRHICWPWRPLKINSATTANSRFHNVKRMLPEMQALLH
ncbi:hypothetical protein K2173_026657 [Erythroxylum novogranatense]|uniref:ATP binding protein n=1 Tax=Erythroxylum novogranatense TaxID=1862640 RepID=A0AAV8U069_9ROSI|nr:hypothetical protein K2173_026657 [Erythroxylum novogranatense]